MSTMLTYKEKVILHTSSGSFEWLYNCIENLMFEQNLSFNEEISSLLHAWYISPCGIGFDIADYIYTKEDLITFTNLVRKGLDRLYEEAPLLSDLKKNNFESFYQELILIQKTFQSDLNLMLVIINWKEIIILKTTSSVLFGLYESIEKIMYEENLFFNKDIMSILHTWFISPGGIGFDIADYIHTKKDLIIFTDLIRMGLERYYNENYRLNEHTKTDLENFYQQLVKAQYMFPD